MRRRRSRRPHHYMYDFAPQGRGQDGERHCQHSCRQRFVPLKHRLLRAGMARGFHPILEFEALQDRFDPTAVTAEMARYVSAKLPRSEATGTYRGDSSARTVSAHRAVDVVSLHVRTCADVHVHVQLRTKKEQDGARASSVNGREPITTRVETEDRSPRATRR